ncbi:MAG TPA: hypothetical protein VH684_16430 [Xanthobacteraceae bacterium]|jgi:hypothetical protein
MEGHERKLQAALAAHARAPENPAPLREICDALLNLKRDDELIPWADKALVLNPRDLHFVCLRAHALSLLGRHFDAVATWQHHASLPWNAAFYGLNLGHNLVMAGDLERGTPLLKEAWQTALASDDALAAAAERFLGEAMLKTGDARGFAHWLARNRCDSGNYAAAGIPIWAGERNLRSRRVLVTNQLGFGDQLLLLSCVSHWLAAGAELMIICDPQLRKVLQASLPQCVVLSAERPIDFLTPLPQALLANVEAFAPDLHLSLLHLPLLAADEVPLPKPYFRPYLQAPSLERDPAAAWARSLRSDHRGKALVGVFWDCVQRHLDDVSSTMRYWAARRSLSLALVDRLVTDPQVRQKMHFVSLQHPAAEAAAGTPAGNVSRYAPGINDFSETAACIEQLDAVVAVDSAVANLSAMIGKPTLVLTHTSGDWRWGARGASTPWLHNVTVLRQTLSGDWSTVVDEAIAWLTG